MSVPPIIRRWVKESAQYLEEDDFNFAFTEVVSVIEVTSDVSAVDFTSLDLNTDKIYILYGEISNVTSSGYIGKIYFNEDYTNTNYYCHKLDVQGTTISASEKNIPQLYVARPNSSTMFYCVISRDYFSHNRYLSFSNAGYSGDFFTDIMSGYQTTETSNLTSIRIYSDVPGGISRNSKIALLKVKSK